MIISFILTTNQLILYWYCKEKIDVDKDAGSERVKSEQTYFQKWLDTCSVSSTGITLPVTWTVYFMKSYMSLMLYCSCFWRDSFI